MTDEQGRSRELERRAAWKIWRANMAIKRVLQAYVRIANKGKVWTFGTISVLRNGVRTDTSTFKPFGRESA